MGGDSFQGTQKLTNAQYQQITQQLTKRLYPFCQRLQPYTPIPEKQVHGDIDFIVLLKQNYQPIDVVEELKITQYKLNKDNTVNSVYKKKQVDFYFVKSHKQFDLVWFYKSYSGLGGYLGVFFPSKIVKVTHKGLFAPTCHFHLKIQFLISDDVQKIMQFYGLDYQRHKKGYKTKKQLYEYLRTVRFLDEAKYVEQVKLVKGTSKLMWGMVQYLKQTGINQQKKPVILKEILKQTIQFFDKTAQYEFAYNKLVNFKKKKQQMSKKFNAHYIIERFEIPNLKDIDRLKLKFLNLMFQGDEQKYLDYVETHSVQQILKQFGQKFNLKIKEQPKKQQ